MNKSKIKWKSTGNKNSSFKMKFACLWLRELTYHLGNCLLILSYNSPVDEKLQIFSICHIKSQKRRLLTSNTKKSIFSKNSHLSLWHVQPWTTRLLLEPFQQTPVSYLSPSRFTVNAPYLEEMENFLWISSKIYCTTFQNQIEFLLFEVSRHN